MKKIILFVATILVSLACLNNGLAITHQTPKLLDRIIAIVNDDIITQTQLNTRVQITKTQFTQAGKELPSDDVIRKQLLQAMINNQLQLSTAKRFGIQVSAVELNAALARIAKQNNTTISALYQKMSKIGWSKKDFRQEIKNEIIIQKLQGQQVASRINISQAEIDNAYKTALTQSSAMKEYHVKNILIALPDAPSPKDIQTAKAKANTIVKKLKAGADFKKIAMKQSSGSKALQGGDLGWRNANELPTIFSKAVIHMKAGEIKGPFKTPNGLHIIKLTGTRLPKDAKITKPQIRALIFQRKLQEGIETFLTHLRGQSYIKIEE